VKVKRLNTNQKFQVIGYQGESSIKTYKKSRGKEKLTDQKLKTKKCFSQNFVEHLIRVLKIFRVASQKDLD